VLRDDLDDVPRHDDGDRSRDLVDDLRVLVVLKDAERPNAFPHPADRSVAEIDPEQVGVLTRRKLIEPMRRITAFLAAPVRRSGRQDPAANRWA
jgi:hypothetical protein